MIPLPGVHESSRAAVTDITCHGCGCIKKEWSAAEAKMVNNGIKTSANRMVVLTAALALLNSLFRTKGPTYPIYLSGDKTREIRS